MRFNSFIKICLGAIACIWLSILLGIQVGKYIVQEGLLEDEGGPVEFRNLSSQYSKPWIYIDPRHQSLAQGENLTKQTLPTRKEVQEIESQELSIENKSQQTFTLQFGVFSQLEYAEKLRDKLNSESIACEIEQRKNDANKSMYVLVSLPFISQAEARMEQERLEAKDIPSILLLPE